MALRPDPAIQWWRIIDSLKFAGTILPDFYEAFCVHGWQVFQGIQAYHLTAKIIRVFHERTRGFALALLSVRVFHECYQTLGPALVAGMQLLTMTSVSKAAEVHCLQGCASVHGSPGAAAWGANAAL